MQIFGIDADAFSGAFECSLKICLLLQQSFVPRPLVIVHFGARARQPLGIAFFRNRTRDGRRLAAGDSAFSEPFGDPILDHLADRAELLANGFGFSNECLQHDVRFALLVAKVAADDLLGGL
ncbi:hypothetical protein HY68_38665 [Streptomyces sp. AcH 505]|nr:hypothetical protein HY68_38665 [Streptomyces sp. AcH 505]